jgi:ubiquinone/menaquinone biosynthesis C-methylase UbiE
MHRKRDIREIGDLFAFYEDEPEVYEILSQSEDIDNRILKTILSDIPFKDSIVLDLGAGTGRFSIPLSLKSKLVCSLDLSKRALHILKRKSGSKEIGILVGTSSNIPFPNEAFDIAISTWAFDPSLPNAENKLAEMLRVTKKGGKIVVVGNYSGGEYYSIRRKFLSDSGAHAGYFDEWFTSRKFKRKVMDVRVDLRSKSNINRVLSGQPPLEMIKRYLAERNRTWFNLRVLIFYYEKKREKDRLGKFEKTNYLVS